MTLLPETITRDFGPLSPEQYRAVARLVNESRRVVVADVRQHRRVSIELYGRVRTSAAIAGASFRWAYDVCAIAQQSDRTFVDDTELFQTDPADSTTWASNVAEAFNTSTFVAPGINPTLLPGSFAPKELQPNTPVLIRLVNRTDGALVPEIVPLFTFINGDC